MKKHNITRDPYIINERYIIGKETPNNIIAEGYYGSIITIEADTYSTEDIIAGDTYGIMELVDFIEIVEEEYENE